MSKISGLIWSFSVVCLSSSGDICLKFSELNTECVGSVLGVTITTSPSLLNPKPCLSSQMKQFSKPVNSFCVLPAFNKIGADLKCLTAHCLAIVNSTWWPLCNIAMLVVRGQVLLFTRWFPAHNFLEIMVCLYAMLLNYVLRQMMIQSWQSCPCFSMESGRLLL